MNRRAEPCSRWSPMVTYMNDKKIRTLEDVGAFLAGSTAMEFSITDKEERYRWIEQTLRRFNYAPADRRSERGVIRAYRSGSGYSRADADSAGGPVPGAWQAAPTPAHGGGLSALPPRRRPARAAARPRGGGASGGDDRGMGTGVMRRCRISRSRTSTKTTAIAPAPPHPRPPHRAGPPTRGAPASRSTPSIGRSGRHQGGLPHQCRR